MRTMFLALLRCISLSLAFALATFSASAFLTFVLFLDSDASWLREDALAAGGAFVFLVAMWFTIAWFAFIPWLIIILIFEFAKIRSALSNILAGGAIAIASGFSQSLNYQSDQQVLPYSDQQVWVAILAAGFVSGFIFWVLAGHRAGKWLPRSSTDTEFNH